MCEAIYRMKQLAVAATPSTGAIHSSKSADFFLEKCCLKGRKMATEIVHALGAHCSKSVKKALIVLI